jgi:hypothetical protein
MKRKCVSGGVFLLVLIGSLSRPSGIFAAETPASPAETLAKVQAPSQDASDPTKIVVATIGDYTITLAELKERLAQAVMPPRPEEGEPNRVVTTEGVLDQMIAEKAMMTEGRKLGYLNDKIVHSAVERFRTEQLVRLMLIDYVQQNLVVTDAEIQEQQKADPNLAPERAKAQVQMKKVNQLVEQFYAQLLEKYKVQKVKENFQKAAQIHQRLLNQPAKPRERGIYWITRTQIDNELTQEEKDLVLATYEGGRLTLADWFEALNDIVPPRRKSLGLDTAEGVEKFTDLALRPPILTAESVARGYDKNEKYLENLRSYEDNQLLNKVLSDKLRSPFEPNDEQIRAYFDGHQAQFAKPTMMKVDQIWCKDLATAQKVKELLTGGASFDQTKEQYSLRKEEQARDISRFSEGVFWDDIRAAEPNDVVGPVKGFYDPKIKWRIVKVLEKTPGEMFPFSDTIKNRVKWTMAAEHREAIRRAYEKDLLAKYPHEINVERIKDIDPFAVSTEETTDR